MTEDDRCFPNTFPDLEGTNYSIPDDLRAKFEASIKVGVFEFSLFYVTEFIAQKINMTKSLIDAITSYYVYGLPKH